MDGVEAEEPTEAADPAETDGGPAEPVGAEGREGPDGDDGWVGRILAALPRPSSPVVDDWEVSLAALVARVPKMPRVVTKPLGLFDRVGAVHIGRDEVGFNGDEISWDRIVEIRTQEIVLVAAGEALEAEVAQYLKFLPPVPGKDWLVRKVGELMFTLWVTVTDGYDEESIKAAVEPISSTDPDPDSLRSRVVSDIVFRRRTLGTGEKSPGLVSMVIAAAVPESTLTIVQEAIRRGIPVLHVPADESELVTQIERGRAWRARIDRVRR